MSHLSIVLLFPWQGTHLSPEEFHRAMMNDNSIMIDVRNFNETLIGKFNPPTSTATSHAVRHIQHHARGYLHTYIHTCRNIIRTIPQTRLYR